MIKETKSHLKDVDTPIIYFVGLHVPEKDDKG